MKRRGLTVLFGSGLLAAGLATVLILDDRDGDSQKPRDSIRERGSARLVSGRVVDELGLPVRYCQVVLEPLPVEGHEAAPDWEAPDWRTRTDDRGGFVLPAGSGPLALTLRPEQAPAWVARTGIRIPPDAGLDLGDLAFPARCGITVRVKRSEDGESLPGATVRLEPLSRSGSLPPLAAAAMQRRARTDDTGRAVFYEVTAGTYRISAEAPNRAPHETLVRHGGPSTGVVSLVLPLAARLRGRVEGARGTPVPGVRVLVKPSGGGAERRARGGPLGSFVVEDLSPGDYRIELVVPESGVWIRHLTVEAGGDALVLGLPEGGRLAGRILGADREPLPGAWVRASTGEGAPLARDGWLWLPGTFAGEDGSFRISGLPAGRFRLLATSEGLASKEAGPMDADGTEVTLLLEEGGILSGKVLDHAGLPLEKAVIELFPTPRDGMAFVAFQGSGPGAEAVSTRSGRGGAFRLTAPAGKDLTLRISARDQAPLVVEPFRVRAGAARDLGVLKMPKSAWIRGRVLDVRGKPVPGASVHADPLPSSLPGTPAATGASDEEGQFSLGPLAPGTYEVFYHSPDEDTAGQRARSLARTRTQVRVEADENHVLEIQSR